MSMQKLKNSDSWISQQTLANELTEKYGKKITVQRVHNWVKRGKISSKYIKEFRCTVVDRNTVPYDLL